MATGMTASLKKALQKKYGKKFGFKVDSNKNVKKKLQGTSVPTYAKDGGMINKKKAGKKSKGK